MTTSRSDRPSSIAERLIGVTRMRSTTPERISAMSPKPPNAVPKIAIWMSRPGTNQLNALAPAAGAPRWRLRAAARTGRGRGPAASSRTTIQTGWRRVSDQGAAEDEPGVADESSSIGFLSIVVGCRGRVRRPLRRGASGRSGGGRRRRGWGGGGRSTTGASPAPSSSAEDLRHGGLAADRRRAGRGRPRRLASRTKGCARTVSRTRSVAPSTPSVMTSPATWRLSSSAVPSATIRPWSMIARRSARASASSR